jgi:sodium/bile acid cotransporter 7
MARLNLMPDRFTLLLLGVVTLASVLPAAGRTADVLSSMTTLAVAALFFLHGAKLSREAIWAGVTHWRLHLLVALCTFAVFPLVGFALRPLLEPLVTPDLYLGLLFLCTLPATVQSAIAFTSMARGNVAAAVCSASASTLLGILVTPLLVSLLLAKGGATSNPWEAAGRIAVQLLLPFIAGHLLRPLIGGLLQRRAVALKVVDQGSILLVVYVAFSHAVTEGLWQDIPTSALAGLLFACAVLLAAVLAIATWTSRKLGFSKEDEITIVFCGSKKSLMNGVPMASVLFAPHVAGAIVLPLMLFHQLQLMVCAVLARRYARRASSAAVTA